MDQRREGRTRVNDRASDCRQRAGEWETGVSAVEPCAALDSQSCRHGSQRGCYVPHSEPFWSETHNVKRTNSVTSWRLHVRPKPNR